MYWEVERDCKQTFAWYLREYRKSIAAHKAKDNALRDFTWAEVRKCMGTLHGFLSGVREARLNSLTKELRAMYTKFEAVMKRRFDY